MAGKFVEDPVGSEFLGARMEPKELMTFGFKDLREDQDGVILGVDAHARGGFKEFLVRVGRELFGESE